MIKGLENLPCEERLKEIVLLSLEKRMLREHLVTVFQYLQGRQKEDGVSLSTRAHMQKTNGNGYQLQGEEVSCPYKKEIIYSKNNH